MAPELLNTAKDYASNLSFPSMSADIGRISSEDEAKALGMSLDTYNSLSDAELANKRNVAVSNDPGFFSKLSSSVSNFFTDDPNTGWYDNMQKRNAAEAADQDLINQAMQGIAGDFNSAPKQYTVAPEGPGFFDNVGSSLSKAYQGGLSALGSDTGKAAMAGLLPTVGGLVGNMAASKNRDASDAAARESIRAAGTASQVGPSSLESYQNDPQALAIRAEALAGIRERSKEGYNPEDMMLLRQARQSADSNLQAQQSKINTDLSRRGLNLSPAQAMVQQQQAAQNLGSEQAAAADRLAANKYNARMSALQTAGNMANVNMNTDFNQAQNKAQDTNAINQFNAGVLNNAGVRTSAAQQSEAQRQLAAGQAKAGNITSIGTGLGGAMGTYLGLDKDKEDPITSLAKALKK
jgi:hypothetical protein